jgi:hypothetical protein
VPTTNVVSVEVEARETASGPLHQKLHGDSVYGEDQVQPVAPEIKIEFSKAEVRPGVDKHPDTVVATITPDNVEVQFDTDKPGTATVAPASGKGKVTLTITGVKLSGANQDTLLRAKSGNQIKKTIPVTVVEPKTFSEDKFVKSGKPTLNGAIIKWTVDVTITFKDNFKQPLGANWSGANVDEKITVGSEPPRTGPLRSIDSKSQVIDPCIQEMDFDKYYPNDHDLALKEARKTYDIIMTGKSRMDIPNLERTQKILVDGKELDGAVTRNSGLKDDYYWIRNRE